jgi:hypothetical protein
MLAFLNQTLFALQDTTKRTVSSSLYHHLSRVHYLHSPPYIIIRAQRQDTLFASPKLQDEIIDQTETLDWLQERLGVKDGHLIELAR